MGREIAVFAGKRVLIVGGGVTGSAVNRSLQSLGATCEIVDEKHFVDREYLTPEEASQSIWDLAVVSPGWKQDHPLIRTLRSMNVPLISEIDLAWTIKCKKHPTQKWIGVTGTNGKTTTVEMIAAMLRRDGMNATACGNLGDAVIEAVLAEERFEILVVELSSFQLQWSELPEFSAAAILNIADDHVDWHGSFEDYVAAKLRILDRSDVGVLNGDDGAVVMATEKWSGKKVFFTLGSPRPGEVGVVEDLLVDRAFVNDPETAEVIAELGEITPFAPHSVLNSLAASSMALSVGASHENIRKAIQEFRPGRHRIELVLEANGIKWINDSKATNPHAALASISAFNSVIWIAGGLSKGAKMEDLITRGRSHIKVAILIGTDRGHIAEALETLAPEIPIILVDKPSNLEKSLMEEIVSVSLSQARSGDVVLLAPACASMDQFISYADRGEQFSEAVLKLVETNEK